MQKVDSGTNEVAFVNLCNRVVDAGLVSVLFVAPLAMGGRFPVGRLLLATVVAITAVSWFVAQLLSRRQQISWFWTGAEWIACLAMLLVTMQLIPLSPGLMRSLSPEIEGMLPLHFSSVALTADAAEASTAKQVEGWNRVSLVPHATRSGLAMAIVYSLLFLVVSQRLRRKKEIELLLKLLASAGLLMAALGLAQYLFGNGKFLWFIEHHSRDTLTAVKGTFANENHFAHFLALTLGPLIWWLVSEQRKVETESQQAESSFASVGRSRRVVRLYLLFTGLGLVLIAGLLTYSRGGLAVMMLSGVICTACFVGQKRLGKRAIMGLAGVVLVAAVAIWIHGQDVLSREMNTLRTASVESLDQGQGRRKIWAAVIQAIPDFAILASGVGSHRYIYPTYFSEESHVQYTHAESGFLQVLLETGGPGFGLLLVGIGISGYWLISTLLYAKNKEITCLAVPLAASWSVSLVHNLADFNWYIPANMTLTIVILAAGSRVWHLSRTTRSESCWSIPKLNWSALTCVVMLLGTLGVTQLVAPARASSSWHEYRAWTLAAKRFARKSVGAGRQRSLGLVDPSQPETIASMIGFLDQSLRLDPQNGRAHVRMAALCLRHFELLQARSANAMSLAQIRDAALSSEFESHEAMIQWVSRVVGDHRVYLDRARWHAGQGIRQTPTEGSGYVYLAEVAFLDSKLRGTERALLQQAYAVRPYNPGVQFVLGHHELLAGNADAAMALWKEAFRRGTEVRRRIIATIGYEAPPEELLRVFQPNLDGLRDIFEYYRRKELWAQLEFVGERLASELEKQAKLMSGQSSGQLWYDAQYVHSLLGHPQRAADAALNSVKMQPTEYRNHLACALRMREAGRLQEAESEFRWCLARRPQDEGLDRAISQVQQEIREQTIRQQQPARTARSHGGEHGEGAAGERQR